MRTTVGTFHASIWIAGDYREAVQACREFCEDVPLCVTVTPTAYVYTGGMEEGVHVRLINYPRFPADAAEIMDKAERLAKHLRDRLCQHSYTIEGPDTTSWTTRRTDVTGTAHEG